ncbi:ISL3 family transposase [Turicibacter sp. GALT-G1]|nr:ISL3 family transposase [Turicibacter sp. GALT-G1]MCU7205850.1 ISL3 family transposase [Turicibacter sp. GALT-G1]
MHLHHINDLIQLQDVTVSNYYISEDHVLFLSLCPTKSKQPCPCCRTQAFVICKGSRQKLRQVRHLRCFNRETILLIPMKRLFCKQCEVSFTYQYAFLTGKTRYTNDYKRELSKPLVGTTVKQLTDTFKVPYSTGERFIKQHLAHLIPSIQRKVIAAAQGSTRLILGIDDFAIRKGHTYNTGFHDLRNGSLLTLVMGRTYQTLIQNQGLMNQLKELKPYAVVMDLARSYHKFVAEVFPDAIRIADRFHVNRYLTDALQAVRRRISLSLTPESRKYLKRNKNLIGKRYDSLSEKEERKLGKLLNYSKELTEVYAIKESLINWYELSDETNSYRRLIQWIARAKALNIPELTEALKPFENWTEEISNYHKCRYTNGSVEGQNNQIKTLIRRSYFLPNRMIYENRIFLECNERFFIDELSVKNQFWC